MAEFAPESNRKYAIISSSDVGRDIDPRKDIETTALNNFHSDVIRSGVLPFIQAALQADEAREISKKAAVEILLPRNLDRRAGRIKILFQPEVVHRANGAILKSVTHTGDHNQLRSRQIEISDTLSDPVVKIYSTSLTDETQAKAKIIQINDGDYMRVIEPAEGISPRKQFVPIISDKENPLTEAFHDFIANQPEDMIASPFLDQIRFGLLHAKYRFDDRVMVDGGKFRGLSDHKAVGRRVY